MSHIQYVIRSCSNSKPYTSPILHTSAWNSYPDYYSTLIIGLCFRRLFSQQNSQNNPFQNKSYRMSLFCSKFFITQSVIKPIFHAMAYVPAILFLLHPSDVTASFTPHSHSALGRRATLCSLLPQGLHTAVSPVWIPFTQLCLWMSPLPSQWSFSLPPFFRWQFLSFLYEFPRATVPK